MLETLNASLNIKVAHSYQAYNRQFIYRHNKSTKRRSTKLRNYATKSYESTNLGIIKINIIQYIIKIYTIKTNGQTTNEHNLEVIINDIKSPLKPEILYSIKLIQITIPFH